MILLSLNLGRAEPVPYTEPDVGVSGIRKLPTDVPVQVTEPGPEGVGGSGLAGDAVCSLRHHGGPYQAVYAYAREDLDAWEQKLAAPLPNGSFGENLTTRGVDVSGARIGERWRIGPELLLQVTAPRIPCRTFAGHMAERVVDEERTQHWVRRFTEHAVPGTYLRVVEPGVIRAGDRIEIVHRPEHEVTVALHFRAVTRERQLLPQLAAAGDALHPDTARLVAAATTAGAS